MPQTREVIKTGSAGRCTVMVAINKCDLPTAKPDRVRQMLQGEGLTEPGEWGGDIICSESRAITGKGCRPSLGNDPVQADMLELTANPNRRADGYVVRRSSSRDWDRPRRCSFRAVR
jgi:translation initiation factor IF-2